MAEKLSSKQYNSQGSVKYAFVTYPSALLYKDALGESMANHLLFGDYVKILNSNVKDGRIYVRSRNSNGWIYAKQLQKERVLEVNFIDIGQGDGCHIVTPDDHHILVDAGEFDNMNRYLTWRFNLYNRTSPLPFSFTAVISHSDKDHYHGFGYIFDNPKIKVDKVYHNGLVERPGTERLGKKTNGYLVELVKDTDDMLSLLNDQNNLSGSGSNYCKILSKAVKANSSVAFKSLSLNDRFLPNFDDTNLIDEKKLAIRILGPLVTYVNNKEGLKSLNNLGVDKNGHSVLLRLDYENVRVLLGGDINEEFGQLIHDHYQKNENLDDLRVDVAKACHHGSHKFYYPFLQSINATATVISSGDDEPYAHPRPDTIGALGKCGYGETPLIFSTELARSNKEFSVDTFEKIAKLLTNLKKYNDLLEGVLGLDEKKVLEAKKMKTNKDINSFVTRYGMINVRADGQHMIIAQKLERDAKNRKWDIHKLEYRKQSKRFEVISK